MEIPAKKTILERINARIFPDLSISIKEPPVDMLARTMRMEVTINRNIIAMEDATSAIMNTSVSPFFL